MKFSEKWLREWVNPPVDTQGLGDQLTFMGLEVDEIINASPGFSGVVIARIHTIKQHPNADKLRVCEVDFGNSDLIEVVCGAPNARAGLITAFAQVGGVLPDGTKLKKAKLRGVVSMGMLCSAKELGLSEDGSGIMELAEDAPVGEDLSDYLELDDAIIDIDLTPDRGDCLSIRGIARDICARNDLPMQLREINEVQVQSERTWPVRVESDNACVRYAGRMMEGVDLSQPSPSWMVERLRRAGVRAISSAVDITNYVMLELGQPMHAFDADKLSGAIQVRHAISGERLELLDGRVVTLDEDTTVIADDSGAIGIAGIMGGASTAVDENTTNVFFESALFLPTYIAGKPRFYSSHTESAHRFERGVDPAGQREALEYASGLMRTIAGGKAGPIEDWVDQSRMPERNAVLVRQTRLKRILGIQPEKSTVNTIFKRLGIASASDDQGWQVTPPSYRYDLAIEEDYIEEVARVIGYENLPRTFPSHRPEFSPVPETRIDLIDIKKKLVGLGYQEVVTYSFVDSSRQSLLRPDLAALPLANPISSELGEMRTTLIGGLLNTLERNLARQNPTLSIFETGLRFLTNEEKLSITDLDDYIAADFGNDLQIDETLQQQNMLAGLVVGNRQRENWNNPAQVADFYSVKADIERLFALANGVDVSYCNTDMELLHPGQRAGIQVDGRLVGYLGALNPSLVSKLGLPAAPIVFELAIHALEAAKVPKIEPLSRFPQVRRDLALMLDQSVSFQALIDTIRKHSPDMLKDVLVFDVYTGKKLPEGKKSIALGLILQDFSRTLEDSEVDEAVSRIVAALDDAHGAVLRV